MADVKWIKIVTDIFDDEKMLLIESLPSADSIIVIWFKLLCLAGKNNNNGVFLMNDRIAYTDEMLATIFRRDVNTVRLALKTFEAYGMIEIIDGVITIPNWGKHQNFDKIEKKTAYMKEYMRDYREKQKEKIENKSLCQNGLSIDEWYEVLKYFNHKCAYCGENNDSLEQEHIIPVNKGGTYCIGNIIPACRHCNSSKGKKDFEKWYKSYELYSDERYKKILDYMCKTNVSDLRKSNVSEADIDIEEDIDKEIEEDKERDKKINNTPPISPSQGETENEIPQNESYKHLFERILQRYTISEYLLEAVREWLKYKYKERNFKYKERSLNTLLRKISESAMEYGDEAVCTAIYESIANGYQGIVWDKIKTEKTTKYKNRTADMLQDSYKMYAEWAEEMEGKENDTKRIYGDCGGN